MYGLRSDCCRSSNFVFNKFVVRWLLEKSMVIDDISLTLLLDCFGVRPLLCKIMYTKGVFDNFLGVDM
jgi:hypothetical protein